MSKKETPDENFAREIQELFTQGKRPTSQFTEEDVRGIARALVGWRFYSSDTRNSTSYETVPVFHPWNHDTSDKHFSSYYNNRIIRGRSGPEGAEELDEVIDMLFETEGSAKDIVRRLYQFFVYPVISDEIESQIIEPLAQVYRDNNFSLVEPLKILLASEHFYSEEIPNSIIKSPIDFLIGVMKEVNISNGNLNYWDGAQHYYSNFNPEVFDDKEKDPSYQKYYLTRRLMWDGEKIGLRFFFPPSVSGWPAYYQAPVYDLFWINSTTSPRRSRFLESFFWGVWINIRKGDDDENVPLKVDFAAYLNSFENPYDVDDVLSEMISRFISITISSETRDRLRNTLLGGNSATHWNDDIANLLSDNPNINDYHHLGNRIGKTLYQLGTLGEFQLH